MAGSLNKVMLIGNLGADPDMKQTQDGKKMALLSLATSESWKDKSTGEKKEKTDWHRIVIFNEGLAGIVESYLKKGSKIFVEGQLRTRKYTDANGVEKFTTENNIIFLNSIEILKNNDEESLWVSAEDPHLNDKAHLLIANFLYEKLLTEFNSL